MNAQVRTIKIVPMAEAHTKIKDFVCSNPGTEYLVLVPAATAKKIQEGKWKPFQGLQRRVESPFSQRSRQYRVYLTAVQR